MIYEIFNNVLGPVTIGPSNFNIAGPARIGRWMSFLIGDIKEIEFTISKTGAYGNSFSSGGAEIGFIGGQIGFCSDDREIIDARSKAEELDIDIKINIVSEEFSHPNYVLIKATDTDNKSIITESVSDEKGSIRIVSVNGYETEIDGGFYEVLMFDKNGIAEDMDIFSQNITSIKGNDVGQNTLLYGRFVKKPPREELKSLKSILPDWEIYLTEPVLTNVITCKESDLPFTTGDELIRKYEDIRLSQAALIYECIATGKTKSEVKKQALYILSVMEDAIENGFISKGEDFNMTFPVSEKMQDVDPIIDTGIISDACLLSTASIESNSRNEKIVSLPTGESNGVLPGVLLSLKRNLGLDDEECADMVLAAGLCGLFIVRNGNFTDEEKENQEEMMASAMAAAAVAEAYGLCGKDALKSATVAMQNILGFIGKQLGENSSVHIVSKNSSGAANAITSVDLTMRGINLKVGFDETLKTMNKDFVV